MTRTCALAGVLLWLSCVPLHAHAHGDLHDQIAAVTAKLRKAPSDAALVHKRGELQRAHGDYQAALADYARAERLAPALRVVQLSRGRALLEQAQSKPEHAQLDQLELAVRSLDAFLSAEPTHAEGLLLRARARVLLGRHADAERDFAAALAQVEDPIPDLFLERADNLRAMHDSSGALSVIEEGLRKLGMLITLDEAALELEIALKRFDAALARMQRLIDAAPRKETLLARKGELLELAGRAELARAARADALAALHALPPLKRKVAAMQELEKRLSR